MIYLASPYTHANPLVMERRFHLAAQASAHLMKEGLVVFSPIIHCHYLACNFNLPKDFNFWQSYNYEMLELASRLIVLTLDGWKESKGVQAEIAHMEKRGLPVEYLYLKEFCIG